MTDGPYAGLDLLARAPSRFFNPDDGDDDAPVLQYPDADFRDAILRLREDWRQYHARRLQRHKTDEAYFTLDYYVPSPAQDREPLKAPTGFQLAMEMAAHLSAEMPVVSIAPRAKDQSAKKLASKQTAWASGFWLKNDITALVRQMALAGAVRGCHVLQVVLDEHAWPRRPLPPVEPYEPVGVAASAVALEEYAEELVDYYDAEERYKTRLETWKDRAEETLPLKVRLIDPQWVLWEPTDDPKKCIVVWDRTVDDVLARHPEAEDALRQYKPGTKVTWCEYWDDETMAYWVEPPGSGYSAGTGGAPHWVVEPTAHGYGFFPFIIDGPWKTFLSDPDRMFPSLYFAIRSFLQYESTLMTQMAHLFRKLGWPVLIINTPNAYNDTAKPKLAMTPGAHNFLGEDEQAHYLELGQGTMAVLEKIVTATDEYIQDGAGLRDVMRGQPKGKSGYQQAQVAAQARVMLVPPEQSIERSLRTATRRILRLVKVFGEKITVMSAESTTNSETALGPKEVVSVGIVKVKLRTVLPIDEAQKIKSYEGLLRDHVLDRLEFARIIGIENPEEKIEAADQEQFEQLPPIAMAKALKHVQENDKETWALMLHYGLVEKLLASLEGGGAPPGQGAPKGGGGQGVPGKPTPPAAPGSAEEAGQTRRQAQQGGRPPRQLPQEDAA